MSIVTIRIAPSWWYDFYHHDQPVVARRGLIFLLHSFPASHALSVESIGAPRDWHMLDLWRQ
ncbi:hypothetical protein CYJ40_06720 [Brevibacterium ravenspurgense]|uniref:Uncharacterized protein n=1 Tax=Brevibacterium ravenspurgense TaxID=479117 RepID=A0A2I1IG17_9MICO|nr:hypothetical protein CYJ40_06720 [Brevibacterium ravenspurgense]